MGKKEPKSYYGGNEAKGGFPVHKQEHLISCGPACMRMIAEWASKEPQSEYFWRVRSGWSSKYGFGRVHLTDEVANDLSAQMNVEHKKVEIDKWRDDPSKPSDVHKNENVVYLLWTDSYDIDGTNIGHWMILVDMFDSDEPSPVKLAVTADPQYDKLQIWNWKSLLASEVRAAYRIEPK